MSPQPRSALSSLDPYVAGQSLAALAVELGVDRVVNLATNETHVGPFPAAIETPPATPTRPTDIPSSMAI